MKSIEAIFKFGNLYDKATRKRILIEDGCEVTISLSPDNILAEDPNLRPEKILDLEEKRKEVYDFISKERCWKVFNSGETLYFYISAGIRRKDLVEPIRCIFQVKLLEDLYIYNKKSEPKDCRFFDCVCLVEKCLTNFEFFEPIYAKSLNDAYTKTYELYFAMFGKSTCNAFDRYFESQDMKVPIRGKTEAIQKRGQ